MYVHSATVLTTVDAVGKTQSDVHLWKGDGSETELDLLKGAVGGDIVRCAQDGGGGG